MRQETVDSMLALWETGIPAKRMWFARKLKLSTDEFINQLQEKMKEKGLYLYKYKGKYIVTNSESEIIPESKKSKRGQRVTWTAHEWDMLANAVWELRKKDQISSFITLVNAATEVLPKNRRRKLVGINNCTPLQERLAEKFRKMIDSVNESESRKEKIAELEVKLASIPTKEQLLDSLSAEEINTYFSDQVIENLTPADVVSKFSPEDILECIPAPELAGYTFKTLMQSLMEKPQPIIQQISMPPTLKQLPQKPIKTQINLPIKKLPKVLIVGGTVGNEKNIIEDGLKDVANISIIDRKTDLPDADFYVIRAKFACHSMQDAVKSKTVGKYIVHRGGISTMIKSIKDLVSN